MNTTGLSDCVYFLLNSRHSTAGGEADFPSFLVSFSHDSRGSDAESVFMGRLHITECELEKVKCLQAAVRPGKGTVADFLSRHH